MIPKTIINTGRAPADFDGVPGVGVCDFHWNRDHFEFATGHVTRFATQGWFETKRWIYDPQTRQSIK